MDTQYRWYYSKNKVGDPKPSICVCRVEDGGQSGIGLAICSRTDNARYSTGREIALNRAKYALGRDQPLLGINRAEAFAALDDTGDDVMDIFDYKAIPSGVDAFQGIVDYVWPPRANAQP